MLDVLIMLTPGRQNGFIDRQNANVRITVLPIIDVKHIVTQDWSCSSVPSDYVNPHASGLNTQDTAITGLSSQHKMSVRLGSMLWKF